MCLKTASDGKRLFFCEYSEVDRKENVLDYINFIGTDRETVCGSNGRDKVNVNTEWRMLRDNMTKMRVNLEENRIAIHEVYLMVVMKKTKVWCSKHVHESL